MSYECILAHHFRTSDSYVPCACACMFCVVHARESVFVFCCTCDDTFRTRLLACLNVVRCVFRHDTTTSTAHNNEQHYSTASQSCCSSSSHPLFAHLTHLTLETTHTTAGSEFLYYPPQNGKPDLGTWNDEPYETAP